MPTENERIGKKPLENQGPRQGSTLPRGREADNAAGNVKPEAADAEAAGMRRSLRDHGGVVRSSHTGQATLQMRIDDRVRY